MHITFTWYFIVILVVSFWISGVSASRRHMAHHAFRLVGYSFIRRVWRVYLRYHAITPNVNEYLFSLGCTWILRLRSCLPAFCHGCAHHSIGPTISFAPLLHDLPAEYLQWLSYGDCVVQLYGTRHLHLSAIVRYEAYT